MATDSLSNPHHRKLELQSLLDLTHLQTQLTTSARQKLDLHFPPSALRSKPATHISLGAPEASTKGDAATKYHHPQAEQDDESDPLRQHVQSLLDAFLHRTWSAAAQSITINGLDAHTLPQFANTNIDTTTSTNTTFAPQTNTTAAPTATTPVAEQTQEMDGIHYTLSPYDSRLQTRLASLYGELESLTAQVSRLRREAPARGAVMLREGLQSDIEKEDASFEDFMRQEQKHGDSEGRSANGDDDLDLGRTQREGRREGWYEDVKASYEAAVAELARLSGHQPSQRGASTAALAAAAAAAAVGAGGGRGGGGGGGLTGCVGKVQRASRVAEELE